MKTNDAVEAVKESKPSQFRDAIKKLDESIDPGTVICRAPGKPEDAARNAARLDAWNESGAKLVNVHGASPHTAWIKGFNAGFDGGLRHTGEWVPAECPHCGKIVTVENGATNAESDLTKSINRGDRNG